MVGMALEGEGQEETLIMRRFRRVGRLWGAWAFSSDYSPNFPKGSDCIRRD